MTRPIRRRTVIGTRPTQAPHGYVIYNAPRPIYGVEWVGDFCSGIFYTALNPEGQDYAKLHELNRQQDAVILTYVTEEEVYEAGKERLLAKVGDHDERVAIINDPKSRGWIIDNQLDFLNRGEE